VTEATLKSKLVKTLKETLPGAVVFRHEDKITAGIPDISVTWAGYTTWLEVKHANPRVRSREIQFIIVKDLAAAGSCFYVVYARDARGRYETQLVHPLSEATLRVPGINHLFIAEWLRDHNRPQHYDRLARHARTQTNTPK